MKTIILIIIIGLMPVAAAQTRDRTTRNTRAAAVMQLQVETAGSDTIHAPAVTLSGYDKPPASTRESLHITNGTGRHLTSVTLSLRYLDMQGRTLHVAEVTVGCDIPSDGTSLVTWASWDRQCSFRYYLSRHGSSRRQSTPYMIQAVATMATACDE